MMIELNMLGKPCPMPVIEAKKQLENPDVLEVVVLVDTLVAVQNLEKMAKGKGYAFAYIEKNKAEFAVALCKDKQQPAQEKQPTIESEKLDGFTVLITADRMGTGDEKLGKILLKGYLYSLTELEQTPDYLIFLNSGIHMVTLESNSIDDLKRLAEKGCTIMACGTCLNYYGKTEELAIGQVVDMYTISQTLAKANKVVSL